MRLSRFQHRESNNGTIVRAEIMKSRVFPDDTGTENLTLNVNFLENQVTEKFDSHTV